MIAAPWKWHQMGNGACVVNDAEGRIIATLPAFEGFPPEQVALHAEAIADLPRMNEVQARFWAEQFKEQS